MAILGRAEIVALCLQVGLGRPEATIAGAICDAESGRNTLARGINLDSSGALHSIDRGLWQINNVYHPDVSDQCAYNALCNARAMYRISSGGRNWHPWSTYNNGAYRQFLDSYASLTGAPPGISPPPPVDAISVLASKIRAGYPFWKAVLQSFEALFGDVRTGVFGDPNRATDLGSKFF